MSRRHPRYLNWTAFLGACMIVGGLIATERGWLQRDTCALLVSLGSYAIARRRTAAKQLDYLRAICETLIVNSDSRGDRAANR